MDYFSTFIIPKTDFHRNNIFLRIWKIKFGHFFSPQIDFHFNETRWKRKGNWISNWEISKLLETNDINKRVDNIEKIMFCTCNSQINVFEEMIK
jgi:hypothetical protein